MHCPVHVKTAADDASKRRLFAPLERLRKCFCLIQNPVLRRLARIPMELECRDDHPRDSESGIWGRAGQSVRSTPYIE